MNDERPDADETCYCCGLSMSSGNPGFYALQDDEGLIFYAHKDCAERDMVAVPKADESSKEK